MQHLRHHAADLGWGVELPLALAAFRREILHQVFVGVAQQVVVHSAVAPEVQRIVLEYAD